MNEQAARNAQAAETQRQQQVQAVIDRINSIYADPANAQQIDQIASDQYATQMDQIARARAAAERDAKAAMARTGMIGSSQWEQSMANLLAGDQQALAQAQANRDALARKLTASLAQSQNNLIQQAQGGLSATAAAQLANDSIAQALANGVQAPMTQNWTQFFDSMGTLRTQAAKGQGRRAALNGYQPPLIAPSAAAPFYADQQGAGLGVTGGY